MSKRRSPKLRRRPLFLEGLEQRAMLAGDVTAVVRGGTLFIRGDNSDNAVVIQQTGSQQFTVVGADADTTVNGQVVGTEFTADRVRNFEIDLRGGDDSLGISNNLTYLADLQTELTGGAAAAQGDIADALTLRGYANILTGDGNDAIAVQLRAGSFVNINSGAGNDAVVVEGSTATSLLVQADTGNQRTDGDDFVRIRGANMIDSHGRQTGAIVVNTLTGDDTIVLADDSALAMIINPSVGGTSRGHTDVDTVSGVRLNARNLIQVFGGADNDTIGLTDITTRNLLVLGGGGADSIGLARVNSSVVTVLGEGGNDAVTVDDTLNLEDPTTPIAVDTTNSSRITSLLLIDTGAGDDTVNITGDAAAAIALRNLNVIMGNGSDGANLSNLSLSGNLYIDMGAGDDGGTSVGGGLVLADVDVAGFLTAFLGSGDDTVSGTNVHTGKRSLVDGGPGHDTITDGGGNSTNIRVVNFETFLP